jgi:hypothetical protein
MSPCSRVRAPRTGQGRGSTRRRKIPHGRRWRMQWPRPAPACAACTMSSVRRLRQATAVVRAVAGLCRAPVATALNASGFSRGRSASVIFAVLRVKKSPRIRLTPPSGGRSPSRRKSNAPEPEKRKLLAGERDGASGGGGRGLPRGAGGTDPRARTAPMGDNAERSWRCARCAWRARERDGTAFVVHLEDALEGCDGNLETARWRHCGRPKAAAFSTSARWSEVSGTLQLFFVW